ncbi:MAG: DUF1580 domain-containing protein [Gemmataceae bacterium]
MLGDSISNLFAECREKQNRLTNTQAAESLLVDELTVHRFRLRGVRLPDGLRVKLETIKIGGRVFTSRQAAERFIRATNPQKVQPGTASDMTSSE